ncbi:Uncharacterised protein [uncultured archaeon]|nr:Uncharacterised protein [uncultured archaeon]
MNKNFLIVIICFIILILLVGGIIFIKQKPINKIPDYKNQNYSKINFTGKITDINYGCTYDAVCYMVIDGKKVVFGSGAVPSDGSKPIWGKVIGTPAIGKNAEVYAHDGSNGFYYLSDNESLYIKIFE